MGLLQRMVPLNLLEEKQKFEADHAYNPQFVFQEPVSQELLIKHGLPQKHLVQLAQTILDEAYFGRNESDLNMMNGPILNEQTVTEKIRQFLEMHNLSEQIKISWSSSYIARATMSPEAIKLRTGATFRKKSLLGTMYHEIGTHALRWYNYEKQPWFKRKKRYGFRPYLRTEEGLASLHTLLPRDFQLAHGSAIRYLAVEAAQRMSFSELWHYLGKYIQKPESRWLVTFRQKRGVADTSQPGGFTKDLTYFEGLVDVWKWLDKHDFDITDLYYGKLAYQDVAKAKKMNPDYIPLLPSFFVLDRDQYAQMAEQIGQINHFKYA